MPSRRLSVKYSVSYIAHITVGDDEAIVDAVNDVDIPESLDSRYVENSFEVERVEDEQGKVIDWDKKPRFHIEVCGDDGRNEA